MNFVTQRVVLFLSLDRRLFAVACQMLSGLMLASCVAAASTNSWSPALVDTEEEISMVQVECALVVRDMGDALALSGLLHSLKQQGKNIRILALGQAARKMLQDDKALADDVLSPDMVAGVDSRLGTAPGDLGGGQGHDIGLASPNDARILAHALRSPVILEKESGTGQIEIRV